MLSNVSRSKGFFLEGESGGFLWGVRIIFFLLRKRTPKNIFEQRHCLICFVGVPEAAGLGPKKKGKCGMQPETPAADSHTAVSCHRVG